ncbi:MAG: hypothetical protein AABX35_04270 [Nanoarchaeota archaeon]
MTEENKCKIEIKIDLPNLKVNLNTEVTLDKVDENLENLLDSISKANKKISKLNELEVFQQKTITQAEPPTLVGENSISGDPLSLIEARLEIESNKLKSSQILGIKNNKVQLFKSQKFTPTEAILVIAYCYEIGLKRQSINYEELKLAYQDSSVKGNTPFRMAINNIKNAGQIDKMKYDSSQEITLTPKGLTKAEEYLKSAITA